MNKKILFIISDTGGGHRSAANAVIAAFSKAGADVTCEMVDLLRASGLPGIRSAPELYAFFSSGHIWLHNFLFRLSNNPRFMDIASTLLYGLARTRVRKAVDSFGPDLVVVIHPLAVRPMCAYRDEVSAHWPVVTIVTDLISIHSSWVSPRADLYCLPTPESVQILENLGVPADKISLTGFPAHPRFLSPPPDPATARAQMGIAAERFTLLITSGGAGGGQVESLVRVLEQECPQCTLLVVTGRNRMLREKLTQRRPLPSHTHVYGFVTNMEQLMAASDVVVTKAGPGTIMEAASLKRPLILTGAIGLQEEGNIRYVLNTGLGVHCPTPMTVAQQVRRMTQRDPVKGTGTDIPFAGTYSIADLLLSMLAK